MYSHFCNRVTCFTFLIIKVSGFLFPFISISTLNINTKISGEKEGRIKLNNREHGQKGGSPDFAESSERLWPPTDLASKPSSARCPGLSFGSLRVAADGFCHLRSGPQAEPPTVVWITFRTSVRTPRQKFAWTKNFLFLHSP